MLGTVRIVALITCHNRREKSLQCLDRLEKIEARELLGGVFLCDDGSTDGTGAAVRAQFPWVRVIDGDGSLFWNGGMRRAWEEAAREDFDAYLWLNDDTHLDRDAVRRAIDVLREKSSNNSTATIVVGSTRDPETGATTYGIWNRSGVKESPQQDAQRTFEVFNGNFVLVNRPAYRLLGNLSPVYRHSMGDIDYGLRAHRAGVAVWSLPGTVGTCPGNPLPKWKDPRVPLGQRWRHLCSPKGCPPKEWAHLCRLMFGWRWPWYAIKPYVRVLFPTIR